MKNMIPAIILFFYIVTIAVLWANSKHATVKDIPPVYLLGLVLSVVHLLIRKPAARKAMGVINIAFFAFSIFYLFTVAGLLKSIFHFN